MRNCVMFVEPVPLAIMAITHPPVAVASFASDAPCQLPMADLPPSPVGDPPSPVGEGPSLTGEGPSPVSHHTETTTEITTTTTTLPSSSTDERAAEPETARGGGGDRDEKTQDPDGNHGETAQEPNEEKTVGKEEAQPVAATEGSSDTTTENPKTVASEEATDEQRPELTYPAKLTEREQEDIAAQVYPLPAEVAQKMLDVIQARIQSGPPIRTNPASMLRGIVRKYQVDPESFDPSSGFQITEARRRRAEADARLRAASEARNLVPATLPLPSHQNGPKPRPAGLDAMLRATRQVLHITG